MITKNIDQITEEDLQDLIDNSVVEHKTIEYKQELPGNSDSHKKEFLADVSSFANARGGNLIYGIIEDRDIGTPEKLEGLTIANVDQEILRLENRIRDGIEPRILGITSRAIDLSSSKKVLMIRVPKSWISPHRVTFKGNDKFYTRSTNGKYPMDVAELRVAFNLSETVTERIRKFRVDRMSKIFANETPVPFYNTAKIILHLIPIISFNPAQSYDISEIASNPRKLPPINVSGWDHKYNFDGFLTYSKGGKGKLDSYVQLFRNGIVEAVDGSILKLRKAEKAIIGFTFEKELIKSLSNYLTIFKTLNVEPPIFLFLTIVGVSGYSMLVLTKTGSKIEKNHTIDRDILLLPEIVIESYDIDSDVVLRPCFDSIWNACGRPKSPHYNEAGKWAGR